jgi:hypothetical protein
MKPTIAALLLLYIACSTSTPEIIPLPEFSERWEVRGGRYADRPVLVRLNRGLDSIANHAPLTWQAAASIPLHHPLPSGLPDSLEVNALTKIEKFLTYRLATSGIAVLGLKVETDNRCDFIFYTENRNAVATVFDHIGTMIDDYRIDFSIKRDKKWMSYWWFSTIE